PRLLLLDEPSAGLNESETTDLGHLLVRLAATGLGVLLVEHDMRFVMGTCERIHVLDFGRIIAGGAPDEIQSNAGVRAAYLGAGPEDAVQQAEELDPDALADVEALAEAVTAETGPVVDVRESAPDDGTAPAALELSQVFAGYGTTDVTYAF